MNDLTKEASLREEAFARLKQKIPNWSGLGMSSAHYGNALASARPNIDQSYGRPKYGNDYLDPDRPLTGRARNYLTRWDDGSRCDLIDVLNINQGPIEEARTGINLDKINRVSDEYRKISDEVDNEIKETETWKNYPDGKKPF